MTHLMGMSTMSNRTFALANTADVFDKLVSVAHQYDAANVLSFSIYWRTTKVELD